MRITSSRVHLNENGRRPRCDVHPQAEMLPTSATASDEHGPLKTFKVFHCSEAGCNRIFALASPDESSSGYASSQAAFREDSPQCLRHGYKTFMAIRPTDEPDQFEYACVEDGCNNTLPWGGGPARSWRDETKIVLCPCHSPDAVRMTFRRIALALNANSFDSNVKSWECTSPNCSVRFIADLGYVGTKMGLTPGCPSHHTAMPAVEQNVDSVVFECLYCSESATVEKTDIARDF